MSDTPTSTSNAPSSSCPLGEHTEGAGDQLVDVEENCDDKESGFEDGSNLSKSHVMSDSIIRSGILGNVVMYGSGLGRGIQVVGLR